MGYSLLVLSAALLATASADVNYLFREGAPHNNDFNTVRTPYYEPSDGRLNSGAGSSYVQRSSNERNFVDGSNPGSFQNSFVSGSNRFRSAGGSSNRVVDSSVFPSSDRVVFVGNQGNDGVGGAVPSGNGERVVTNVSTAPRSGVLNADLNVGSSSGRQVGGLPTYETHVFARAGVIQLTTTVTTEVTTTHKLRVPSTSDVWVTDVTMVKFPVTVLSTQYNYSPLPAETVTSFIRVTRTEHEFFTRTVQVFPTKTFVSVFTQFVTQTSTVELWQPVVHEEKQYEVLTVPVMETQVLLQHLYTTLTVTSAVDVTSFRRF